MSNRLTYIIAGILLFVMFFTAFLSIRDDSLTFDEVSHIPSGYSYLTQKDYRLNAEHPPLIKDLAAIPLLFLDLNFPKDHSSWLQEGNPVWWLQFDFGNQFLYHSENDPDKILLWSRLPMILLLILLGLLIFLWTKSCFGNKAALLALFLFSFSPTFLAHGRLVTTDVGAAFGVVLAIVFWLKFLKEPLKKNIVLAGLAFGVSMLLKFSLILLLPFFGIITLIYALYEKKLLKYIVLSFLVLIIGMVFIVWPVYQYHILNYPIERQIRDTEFLLSTTTVPKPLADLDIAMISNPASRPFSQYFLGILMVLNRSTTGNTTYFLGEISAAGWKTYFPVVYSIKEPLTLHILSIIALLGLAWYIKEPFWKRPFQRTKEWIKSHFAEFSMFLFIIIYWATSLTSNLNIGVRHLLPTFPFIFILVSIAITKYLKEPFLKIKYGILALLIFWQASSVMAVYPHFLAYFNESAGGPDNGYLYVTDSNLDWGQDLKRLKKWTDDNNIDKLYLDYFGGGNPEYYLKEKYLPWPSKQSPDKLPKSSYLAVSVNSLQGGRAEPVKGFDQPSNHYRWLDKYQPITKIGYSIFIYYIE
ncbi:glycosyltransferase family 39 protein [Candidatus Parcubacteria bacterium]|nr:glycosyltransferase family 39 protein [Candidatus Parcubacteria bacterium]